MAGAGCGRYRGTGAGAHASGKYRAVDLTPERGRLAGMTPVYRCDGCWRELAREVGADAAAITVVHKS